MTLNLGASLKNGLANITFEVKENSEGTVTLKGYALDFPGIEVFTVIIIDDQEIKFQFNEALIAPESIPKDEILKLESNLKIMIKNTLSEVKQFSTAENIDEIEDNGTTEEIEDDDIKYPFDPKQIKIIVESKTIGQLVERLKFDEIDLNTEFQRKGNLWKSDQQSRLIESIMLRFPLPAFYFDAENDDKWLVVDGLQRIWAIKRFIVDQDLSLTGLEMLREYSGQNFHFSDLSRTMQRRILETSITTYIIQPGTPKHVKYNVFRRINTGGLGLNAMEIRHALNVGQSTIFLKELSESFNFKSLAKVRDNRMEDRELILRALTFMLFDQSQYIKPLAAFLDRGIEKLNSLDLNELTLLKTKFYRSLNLNNEIFGKNIFSRSVLSQLQYRLNNALFEVWVSELSKISDDEARNLILNKEQLISDYSQLIKDEIFTKSVVSSTSDRKAVKERFTKIQDLISKHK